MAKRWVASEEAQLLDCVKMHEEEGKGLKEALSFFCGETGRPEHGVYCKYRELVGLREKGKAKPTKRNQQIDGLNELVSYVKTLQGEVSKLTSEINILQRENESLKSSQRDLDDFARILENARKTVMLPESDPKRFQMDQNGNLERVGR